MLTPTRELAIQVAKDFKDITKKLAVTCFYGGSSYNPQSESSLKMLRRALDSDLVSMMMILTYSVPLP